MCVNTHSSIGQRRLLEEALCCSEAQIKSYYGPIEQDDLLRFSPNISGL